MKKLLNGKWLFKANDETEWLSATVPGCNFLDLMDNGKIDDPFLYTNEKDCQFAADKDWEYKCTFSLDENCLKSTKIFLTFDMLDTLCDIYLNDELIGSTDNCFLKYRFDVTGKLKTGNYELRLYFHSPKNFVTEIYKKEGAPNNSNGQNGIVHIRKPQSHFGWDWGPVLTPSGVTRDVYLEFIDSAEIKELGITQKHFDSKVEINVNTVIENYDNSDIDCELTVICPDGTELKANGESHSFIIENPELWWTYEMNKVDTQPLYIVKAVLNKNGEAVSEVSKKIGLRTIELNRDKDKWGQNFQFILNGKPVFAKGGDVIPQDSFITRFNSEKLHEFMEAVRFANFNMLRMWGGGYYSFDELLDECDKYGVLIWQDFQFACQAYPFFKEDFLNNVKKEIEYNVKRISTHPCLALWCGNNEIEQMKMGWITMREYVKWTEIFFYNILPEEIRKYDEATPIISGSPSGTKYDTGIDSDNVGDTHIWAVWHGLKPMNFYRQRYTRFCSEFGFECLPDIKTVKKIADEKDYDLNSEVFLSHQKCINGNDKVVYYIASRFNLPKKFEDYIYLSQVSQMECIEDATAFWRRNKGRCNGAIYWQFNDCWPVCSWSGIDYYGNYKALQYASRRFNSPVGISVDDSKNGIKIYALNDTNDEHEVKLQVEIFDFTDGVKDTRTENIKLKAGEVKGSINLHANVLSKYNPKTTGVCVSLFENGKLSVQKTVLLKHENKLNLPKAKINMTKEIIGDEIKLTLLSDNFARLVNLQSSISSSPFSDNFFDLLPKREYTVTIKKDKAFTIEELSQSISVMSLCDVEADKDKSKVLKNRIKVWTSPVNIGNATYHGKVPKDTKVE